MDRTLSLEFARVVEAAALRSGRLLGRGQKDEADGLAVDAMRQAFDSVRISGTVVIGEGEIDESSYVVYWRTCWRWRSRKLILQ